MLPQKRSIILLALLLLPPLFAGCDLLGTDDEGDDRLVTARVIVGNGGNFGDQTGSLTLYDPETGEAVTPASLQLDAFITALGLHEEQLYVVLNTSFTSGRVDVVDLGLMEVVEQYTGLGPVRTIAFDEGEAYLPTHSPAAIDTVTVLDLDQAAVVDDGIPVGDYPEGVAVVGGRAYVANAGLGGAATTLTVIDTATDQAVGTLDLGCDGPAETMVDDQGELVVACTGHTTYDAQYNPIIESYGQIVFVDTENGQVVDRIELDRQTGSANNSQGAYYSSAEEEAYVLAGDVVYRVDTEANTLAGTLAVPETPGYVGLTAVAYDADADRLYLGRFAEGAQGMDYTADGLVLVLDRGGEEVARFQAGPSPSHIVLQQQMQ